MSPRNGGCRTCKLRRVKCDETKPICQRCSKAQRVCVEASASKQAEFSIHVENQYASGIKKRPRGPRSSLTVRPVELDLETKAVSYYYQYHLQVLEDSPYFTAGLPECVSYWKTSRRRDSMVDLALSCMALAVYSRTQQHPTASAEGSKRFYQLLQVVQDRLAHVGTVPVDEANVDACLLTVFLMARYTSAAHRPDEPEPIDTFEKLQGWSHRDGSTAIMKVWHDNFSSDSASVIVKQTRRGLIRSSLLRRLPVPDWMLDGVRFGESEMDVDHDRIFVRVVNLCYDFATLQQDTSATASQMEELNAQAQNLDEAMQKWGNAFPSTYAPEKHTLDEADQTFPRQHFYSSDVQIYPSIGQAAVWSQYYATRMLINSRLMKILTASRPDRPFLVFTYARQMQDCVARVKDMGERLASNVPFALECVKVDPGNSKTNKTSITLNEKEDVKPFYANLVIWPLSMAASLEAVDSELRQWFRSELSLTGRMVGDGILQCAEAGDWPML